MADRPPSTAKSLSPHLPRLVFIVGSIAVPLLLFSNPSLWYWFIGPLHFPPPLYPFLDMQGRLAHIHMSTLGWDVYSHPNPLDPMNRVNNKPSVTLALGNFGLRFNHLIPVSIGCISLFFLSVFTFLRPVRWSEAITGLLVMISPPLLLLLERANDDILIFLFLAPLPWLMTRKSNVAQFGGWALVAVAAMIKIYPIAAFAALLKTPRKPIVGIALLLGGIGFFLLYYILNFAELSVLRGRFPSPEGMFTFAATELPRSLNFEDGAKGFRWAGFAFFCTIAALEFFRSRKARSPEAQRPAEMAFLIGASILTFCFFFNSNWDYRWAFTLFLLPKIFEDRNHAEASIRIPALLLVCFLLPSLYVEYLGFAIGFTGERWVVPHIDGFHLLRQITTWLFFGVMIFISARSFGTVFTELSLPIPKTRQPRPS